MVAGVLLQLGLLASGLAPAAGCNSSWDCSLNGQCLSGGCVCDPAWTGPGCERLSFRPGLAQGVAGRPLCAYHGPDPNSTSWGGSVLWSPEERRYFMWVAEMLNHCGLGSWRTNSAVALAVAQSPEGPFERVRQLVGPWAHNPQAIRVPDPSSATGWVFALYTLGDGLPNGPAANCNGTAGLAPTEPGTAGLAPTEPRSARGTISANFTIHWAESARGPYSKHVATILDWPAGWDYGAHGNWNPAPMVHPTNRSVYLMVHTSPKPSPWHKFSCGEAIIAADSWRGPYRLVASDTMASWGGSTCGSEDPFMWMDARGHWHALFHYMHPGGPGGHAFSMDGIRWSNVSAAYGEARPLQGGGSVSYGAERPKLLFGPDGAPTHMFNGAHDGQRAFTISQPLQTKAIDQSFRY